MKTHTHVIWHGTKNSVNEQLLLSSYSGFFGGGFGVFFCCFGNAILVDKLTTNLQLCVNFEAIIHYMYYLFSTCDHSKHIHYNSLLHYQTCVTN